MSIVQIRTRVTSEDLVTSGLRKDKVIECLQMRVLPIVSIILILMAAAVTALVALGGGGVPPLFIAAAVAGILLAGVAGYFAISSIRPSLEPPLPKSFLGAFKACYGDVLYEFAVKQLLTIQELRSFMRWVDSGFDMNMLTGTAQIKAKNFGLKKLKKAATSINFLFESFLLVNCPIYFVKKIIDAGDPKVAAAKGMSPQEYWTAPLGFSKKSLWSEGVYTVFDTRTYLLAEVLEKREYQALSDSMRKGFWEMTSWRLSCLQRSMLEKLAKIPKQDLLETRDVITENIKDDTWF
ncbi:DUF1389 domain-containing protein [Chlamydia vaughanii]|uniref:DUF1389 domain-containing protein n=1 Tax=Chlamydia vaughanii TaxID=3112552 RepID=UPI0032B2F1E2